MTKLKKTSKPASLGLYVLDFSNLRFIQPERLFRISIFGFRIFAFAALAPPDPSFRRRPESGGGAPGHALREIIRFGCGYAALVLFVAGCDPVLNIGGTFFPGWMVSILIGSALTVAIRYVFVFTRLERHVGPLALVYTSLGLLLSVVSWLILYRS
jgi:hypothetical protein